MRKYECFYAEESIRDLPEYEEIASRYPELEWIEDYQSFRKANTVQEKKSLIFARKRGSWLKPFHCYDNRAYRFLSLDLAEGCLFDCVYCYLQSYLNHGALVLFLGFESLLTELSNLGSQRHWISTGLLSDSLLAENQFPFLRRISAHMPADSILELRSKAADLSSLTDAEIERDRIVVSWSLNPPEIVQAYEYGTSTLEERLKAASEAIRLGYRIAFHLDPVFYFDGWKEAYAGLFAGLDQFPTDRLAFLTVGLFRYMPGLGAVIRKRFPYHPILAGEFFPDEDGKYHYFRSIRKEMYEAFTEWLKRWSEIPVFWSMEPDTKLISKAENWKFNTETLRRREKNI
jgi:DNA repair photolyase